MNAQHDKLSAAAASVTEWQGNVRTINEKIAKAAAVFAESQKIRQEHVLSAALGDNAARERLDHVLEEDRKAEREVEILRSSLRIAETELRNAENAHRAAEAEFRKAEVNRLARERVAAADKIDSALAAFSSAFAEYESIGQQLFSASVDRQDQIYLAEHFDGLLRLAAALPHEPFYSIRWKHSFANIGGGVPLAVAEASFWRLPAADEAKAA
jgi:hypothetical protein